MKKVLLSLAAVSLLVLSANAAKTVDQTMNPLITAMPSLSIAPDARSAGMGDIGVATDADLNSLHWNAAKYAYMQSAGGITANYTPWLRKLVSDIDLAHIAGYYNFGDLGGGIAASFTYFSLGNVSLTDNNGTVLQDVRPNEWSLDLSYYRKLHEYVSMAVALRFMYSDLNNGYNSSTSTGSEMYPAWTMAADVSLYYHQPIELPMGTSYFSLGFALQNLGGKMTYDKIINNFIPATMRIGVNYELPFDKYNSLTFGVQADKLMVPSRLSKYADGEDGRWTQEGYSALSSVKGIFQSFADAPGGALEEFKEVRWGAGLEYSYNKQFFARFGYSYENYYKGNRNYLTAGAGFHLSIFSLDVAYCIGLSSTNPLDQTMRFTLGFDLAGIKDLVNNRK
ncbi:MAG: type IX secretion system outer membrane channel protein PorV [Paludibacteraceae bacterium]|nr:type IX secretion system outer membrane channel protein PorV [Bacteroidales bacterium]MDY4149624.1 type IX secretion system outer membrane channel protein PorV [Paludibacteraceae bacterium]